MGTQTFSSGVPKERFLLFGVEFGVASEESALPSLSPGMNFWNTTLAYLIRIKEIRHAGLGNAGRPKATRFSDADRHVPSTGEIALVESGPFQG
jgi:hypothetical protein